MITQNEAIRNVVREDLSMTNDQIKREVFANYGFEISTNQICNVVGPYYSRRFQGKTGGYLVQEARTLVEKVGSKREAVKLINLIR